MAFLRCGGKLQSMRETTLWTNSSTSTDFDLQTVNLSQSINNFDYIKVQYKSYKSNGTTFDSAMCDVSDFINSGGTSYPISRPLWIGVKSNASDNYSRAVNYSTTTKIQFSGCVKFGSSTIANGYCIPLKIIGVKMN